MTQNSFRANRPDWISPLVYLPNNWLSLTGVITVTTATVFWLFLLPTTLRGATEHPYVGILGLLILPALLLGFFLVTTTHHHRQPTHLRCSALHGLADFLRAHLSCGDHTGSDGRTVTQDCSACHNLLAVDDPQPKILADLGLAQISAARRE